MNKFCIWTPSASVRVRCRDFSKLRVYAVYSNRRPLSLFGEHCDLLQTAHMANFEENVEEMLGTTREAAAVAGRDGGTATTGDETVATAGDETAATGGVMFTDEGQLEFDEDEMAALEGQRLKGSV